MKARLFAGLPLLALLLSAFCACGGPQFHTLSPEDVRDKLLAACAAPDALVVALSGDETAADAFAAFSDLNPSVADSFFLAWAKDGKSNADEIAVILLKNSAAVQDAAASLETHLEGRKKLYAASAPLQKEKLDADEVFTVGRYAVLLVNDNAKAMKTAFLSAVTD